MVGYFYFARCFVAGGDDAFHDCHEGLLCSPPLETVLLLELCAIALNGPPAYRMIESWRLCHNLHGYFMENSRDKQDKPDKPEEDSQSEQGPGREPTVQTDSTSNESDERIPVSEETHGNRTEEKIENRTRKKQETHEEAKSIAGTEAHHDSRNEHPDSGPAPLDRY
jgi:hypothetical protein